MNFDNDLNNSIKAFFEIIKDEHDKLEEVEKEPFIDETFMGIQMTISNVIGKIVQEKYSDLFTN
jgi:hypothetical protein